MPANDEKRCLRLTLRGTVQGVGMRPYIKKRADSLGVSGWVQNTGGVRVFACGAPPALEAFVSELQNPALSGAVVSFFSAEETQPFEAAGFAILPSGTGGGGEFPLPPDLPVCPHCLADAMDPTNRRYLHPLVSCASCGPRFSIANSLPYDRENTAMAAFGLCPGCAAEYRDPSDRRFHAQTISCHGCGPQVRYTGETGKSVTGRRAIESAAAGLNAGNIVMVKGIGGYHLACRPDDEAAAQRLRELKGRDAKPFAVMFPDLDSVKAVCAVSAAEETLLCSAARPIVPLEWAGADAFAPNVCAGSPQCGCFLPYTALHHILLDKTGPLVLTSANKSGSPILWEDGEAAAFAAENGVACLAHDRAIARPLEDSVARAVGGEAQIIRRARGYVPASLPLAGNKETLLAFGGDLKAAFCFAHGENAYMGPPFGDLENAQTQALYAASIREYGDLLGAVPTRAACDLHPGYFSRNIAEQSGLPLLGVQHHHAHALSVMAEHGLPRAIGVVLDGTGYGTDGAVWGCEFLDCDGGGLRRAAHLSYTKIIGGDASMKDARKTAACFLLAAGRQIAAFDERHQVIEAAWRAEVNTVRASSAGRLFDAAAAILLGADQNRYEGECAIRLEHEATRAQKAGVQPYPLEFGYSQNSGCITADPAPVIRALFDLRNKKKAIPALAFGFHTALAEMIRRVCVTIGEETGVRDVALSGGVFQNALLLELAKRGLQQSGFAVWRNESLPPNDGCIAYGQAAAVRRN